MLVKLECLLTSENVSNIFKFVKEHYKEDNYEDCITFFLGNTGTEIFDKSIRENLGKGFVREFDKQYPTGCIFDSDDFEFDVGKLIVDKAEQYGIIDKY